MFSRPPVSRRVASGLALFLAMLAFTGAEAEPLAPEPGWPAYTPESRPWTLNWWLGSAVDEAANWPIESSGLLGPVTLRDLETEMN